MASLERRNKTYRIVFMYQGRKRSYSLKTSNEQEAEAFLGGAEKILMRIEQKLLDVPPGVDIVEFVQNDGQMPTTPIPQREPVTFAQLQEAYLTTHENGVLEESSLVSIRVHLRHFERTLGKRFPIHQLATKDLQRHINERRIQKFRGKDISPATLKKEITTLRAIWNWAVHQNLLEGQFPGKGLVYPKGEEKPPFMTWAEIERRIQQGKLTKEKSQELWEALYLRKIEIDELLDFVKENATQPWVYPLVCTAAHTGARRSELLRIEIADVDFEASSLLIREKKRSSKQRTTRHVTLSSFLHQVLTEWLKHHPGGTYLFCQEQEVSRSKKRSRTTGHKGQKSRPTTSKERNVTITTRALPELGPLTKDEAHDHFKRTLRGSKWEVVKGYHVLRHSFISCLAAAGVDQRIIDDFVGHQTDEQRRRYRHLLPDVKLRAIQSVFG